MNKKRVLFFCSPIGLGHASRDASIMNHLTDIEIKFVAGGPAAGLLKGMNFDVFDVYKPPNFDVKNGILGNRTRWLWNYFKYYRECKKIAESVIKEYNPDLVISDEDFASLVVAQKIGHPTCLITDILKTQFTNGFGRIIEKKMNDSMNKIIRKCNLVIIPENGTSTDKIFRVGLVVRETRKTRDEIRNDLGFVKPTVLVTVGGTTAGIFLLEKIIKIMKKFNDFEFVFVAGPSIKKNYNNVKNFGFVNNLHEMIYASDLVVSLAGKSTMDEARYYGTPGIFIPIKNHFEQEDNAREEGYSFEDIDRLEDLIRDKINSKRGKTVSNGAEMASRVIREFLELKT